MSAEVREDFECVSQKEANISVFASNSKRRGTSPSSFVIPGPEGLISKCSSVVHSDIVQLNMVEILNTAHGNCIAIYYYASQY